MGDEDDNISIARDIIREHMEDSAIYRGSVTEIMQYLRAFAPQLDNRESMRNGALFGLALGIFFIGASECEEGCIHRFGHNVAAFSDRVLMDLEYDDRVRT